MKNQIRILTTIIMVFLMLVVIFYPKLRPLFQRHAPTNDFGLQAFQARPLNVDALLIQPEHMVEFIHTSGTLLPDEEVDLSFETSGKIVSINFQEGTEVARGELLAKINDRHLQAQLLKLQAQLRLAEDREFRQRSLLSRDAISQEAYDQAVTELESLEADILLLEARIAETELRAPFDGIVGLRYMSEGSFANPASHIARLLKTQPLKIEFSVPERYSGEIRPGFPLRFRIDGFQQDFRAEVYAIDPMVDVRTRTIVARALYPNTMGELQPGRFASIVLQLSEMHDAIAIPTEALIPQMDGDRVFVYRSGQASAVPVRTGLRTEAQIQILEGLQFGDTLLTTGVLQLREGLPVTLDTLIQ